MKNKRAVLVGVTSVIALAVFLSFPFPVDAWEGEEVDLDQTTALSLQNGALETVFFSMVGCGFSYEGEKVGKWFCKFSEDTLVTLNFEIVNHGGSEPVPLDDEFCVHVFRSSDGTTLYEGNGWFSSDRMVSSWTVVPEGLYFAHAKLPDSLARAQGELMASVELRRDGQKLVAWTFSVAPSQLPSMPPPSSH